jgi:hypothetical protein
LEATTMKAMKVAAAGLVLGALTACGNGVGTDGAVVGGSCAGVADCSQVERSRCETGSLFPEGYCLHFCRPAVDDAGDEQTPCRDGAACVDLTIEGRVCLDECDADGDCRDGYTCQTPTEGGPSVCLGPGL